MASFLPSGGGGNLSPDVMRMMGRPSGGFNPTALESAAQQVRQMQQNAFMAHVLRSDARSSALSGMIGSNLFGDKAAQNAFMQKIGGASNFNETLSFLLNMPGISSYIGGSHRSLGIGSMAAATSGMMMNGFGIYGSAGGAQWIQNQMATSVFNHVNSRFYGGTGAPVMSMTQGLNRDQIGGIMMMGAGQGAFAGMGMGSIQTNAMGTNKFIPDKGTLDKISNFTQNAAKALSSIMDIYGSDSVAGLFQRAQSITGMDFSKVGNAKIMADRLSLLRSSAASNGIDVSTAMDVAAGSTAMGMALGSRGPVAGAMAVNATLQGMAAFRQNQLNAGSFFMATPSLQESAAGIVRDQQAMYRDPLGARRAAVEMMIQEGTIKGAEAESTRKRVMSMNPNDMAGLDREMSSRHGVHMESFIRSMGGPEGVMSQLNEEGKARVLDMNNSDLRRRQGFQVRRMMQSRLAPMGAQGSIDDFGTIMNTLSAKTANDLLTGADAGAGRNSLLEIVSADVAGTLNPEKFVSAAQRLSGATGGRAAGINQFVRRAMINNPFTKSFMSESDAMRAADRARREAHEISDSDRGFMRQGMLDGILSRLGGTDPRSIFALAAAANPDQIMGIDPKFKMQFDRSLYFQDGKFNEAAAKGLLQNIRHNFRGQSGMMSEIFGGQVTRDQIAHMSAPTLRMMTERLTDPIEFQRIFKGFEMFRGGQGNQLYSMFMSKQMFDDTSRTAAPASIINKAANSLKNGLARDELLGIADTLLDTKHKLTMISGGHVLRRGRALSAEETADLARRGMDRLNSMDVLMGISPDVLSKMAGMDHTLGQQMFKTLSTAEIDQNLSSSERKKIKDRIGALGAYKDDDGTIKISGLLKLVKDDTVSISASGKK